MFSRVTASILDLYELHHRNKKQVGELTKKNRMTIVGTKTHRVGFDRLLFLPAGPLTLMTQQQKE